MCYNVKRMCIKSSPHREGSKMRDTPDVKCKKRGKRRVKNVCLVRLGHGEKVATRV